MMMVDRGEPQWGFFSHSQSFDFGRNEERGRHDENSALDLSGLKTRF
jgi:hypothetical protein